MANCKCGRKWVWDWCCDVYRYDDTEEEVQSFRKEVPGLKPNLHVYITLFTCNCGLVNSVELDDEERGGFIVNFADGWDGIDWDTEEHAY